MKEKTEFLSIIYMIENEETSLLSTRSEAKPTVTLAMIDDEQRHADLSKQHRHLARTVSS